MSDRTEEAPPSKPAAAFPWGTLLGNVAAIAGAHALGYTTAGLLTNALAKSRFGAQFARMPADTQRRVLGQIIGAAGSVGVVATGMAHASARARLEAQRLENERKAAEASGNTKTAAVFSAYASALVVRS